MKIHTEIGSKERFQEIFQGVNKTTINENSIMGNNPTGGSNEILEKSFLDLKNKNLRVNNTNSSVDGNNTFIEINCTNVDGHEIIFSFKTTAVNTEQDNVISVDSAQLESFSLNNPTQPIIMDVNQLQKFNERYGGEMIDIVSEFAGIEDNSNTADDQYNEAVNLIDKIPYNKSTEDMQTNKSYADQKPTNPKLRVKSPELDSFLGEVDGTSNGNKNKHIKKANNILLKEYDRIGKTPSREEHIIRVKKGATNLSNLDTVNEDDENNYPDQMGKKFKPKNQFPKKKKRPQSVVKLKEDDEIDISGLPEIPSGWGFKKQAKTDITQDYNDSGIDKDERITNNSDKWGENPMPYDKEFKESIGDEQGVDDNVEQIVNNKEETGDLLAGGLADNESPKSFDPEQLAIGLKVEMEHTDNPMIAIEIVMDHMIENSDYYTHLNKMEKDIDIENSETGENDDLTDELLGFKSHNVGEEFDYAASERDYFDKIDYEEEHPLSDILSTTGDDVNLASGNKEIDKGINKAISEDDVEYQGDIGDRYEDANNNQFTVSKKTNGGVGLRGNEGEKEIESGGLEFMKKLEENKNKKIITEQQIKIARKVLKDRGFDDKMTKKEAIQLLILHNIK